MEDKQLLEVACFSADEQRVRSILSNSNCTNYLDSSDGYTLLCRMLKSSIFSTKQFQILRCTRPEYKQHLSKYLNISKILLEHNVRVNSTCDKVIDTPLHLAVLTEDEEIVRILLTKGAIINAKNQTNDTPLHLAVLKNAENIVLMLLEKGADMDVCNRRGNIPLHNTNDSSMETIFGKHKIKTFLDEGGDLEEKDFEGCTLLHSTVISENEEVVAFLLEKEPNVNAVTDAGETPLHFAAQVRNLGIVTRLIEKGANVNATTKTGCTPLHMAAQCNFTFDNGQVFQILINNGAKINAKNSHGLLPLNFAVKNQSTDDVKILLGDNPEHDNRDFKRAFCLSFYDPDYVAECLKEKERKPCVSELFFDLGFRIFDEDFDGMTIPEQLYPNAIRQSTSLPFRFFVINLLKKSGTACKKHPVSVTTRHFFEYHVFVGAVKHGFTDIFYNLIPTNLDVNALLHNQYKLLHLACESGHLTIVDELLRRGADINAVIGNNTMTPLHLSVRKDSVNITKILLQNRANIEALTEERETPLFLAVELNSLKCIRLLLESGANVNSVTAYEKCPLHRAVLNDAEDVVQMLLHYGAFVNANSSFKIKPIFKELRDRFLVCTKIIELLFDYDTRVVHLDPVIFNDTNKFEELKTKAIAVSQENLNIDNKVLGNFQTKCLDEIRKMKLMKIDDYTLTIHDLLVRPHRRIAIYMRNRKIVEILDSMDFKSVFPIFASKLRVCLMRGKLENRLIELCYECIELILKIQFPAIVVSQIISYFNTADLHRLIIASPISSEKKKLVQYNFDVSSNK